MATDTTSYDISPADGWVSVAATSATYLKITPTSRQPWALFIAAGAPVTTPTQSSVNLSYTGQPTAGSKASADFTLDDDSSDGETVVADETVTIGSVTYTFKATLTGAANEVLIGADNAAAATNLKNAINGTDVSVQASSVLTLTDVVTEDEEVVIGSTTYVFKDSPSAAYEVAVGASASESLSNLRAAINGAPNGGRYGPGTYAHPSVTAVNDALTLTVTAIAAGVAANSLATTTDAADGSWADTTLGGGTGASTPGVDRTFGVGTVAHDDVLATVSTRVVTITAKVSGAAANAIATTETVAGDFAEGTLTLTPNTPPDIADETVQIDGVYYQFAADPTTGTPDGSMGSPYLVDVGVDDGASLANLLAAVNASGTPGTTYSEEIVAAHATVEATASDGTTVSFRALTAGEAGNSISTTADGDLAFGAANLTGGGGSAWDGATMNSGTPGVDGDTITLAGQAYQFVAELSDTVTANEVLLGATAADSYDNLEAAVNGAAGEGTLYGEGTTANTSVFAAHDGSDDVLFTVHSADGTDGDGTAVEESLDNATFDGAATETAGAADIDHGAEYSGNDEVEIETTTDGAAYIRVLGNKSSPRYNEKYQFTVLRDAA